MAIERLLNRDAEVESLDRLLGGVTTDARGAGLVIRGAPGLGKSALLRTAERRAAERGWRVLRTDGTPAEMSLPLAALHKLVRPVLNEAGRLPVAQRAMLDGAFGRVDAPRPELFQVAMAVLDLLAELATDGPVAVLLDDAHWLDRSSAEVLTFIARRLESDPILLLAAARSAEDDPMAGGGLPELVLGALDETSSAALRSISDAGAGRFAEAYQHLARVFRPTDSAHHRMQACWALGSLAEAAVQSGHRDEARQQLAVFDADAAGTPSAGIQVALRYARALLADPARAEEHFIAALDADLRDWPFGHGRILLAYGS